MQTLFKDIELPTMGAVGNHEFINSDLMAVPSSGEENELYLVEISTGTVRTVALDASAVVSTGSTRGRIIKHITGTPYLWITAKGAEEVADRFCYVVMLDMKDLTNSKVVRKVMGLDTASMLFVENMGLAHFHRANAGNGKAIEETQETLKEVTEEISDMQAEIGKLRGDMSTSTSSMQSSANGSSPSSQDNTLSIVAICVGVLAIGVALAALFKKPQVVTSSTASHTPATIAKSDEELSMGSKRDTYA